MNHIPPATAPRKDPTMDDFIIVTPDDGARDDLDLVHYRCGAVVCSVQANDTLAVLISVAEDHVCHRPAHYRNEHGELVPACACGWETTHAYYGDRRTIEDCAARDYDAHITEVPLHNRKHSTTLVPSSAGRPRDSHGKATPMTIANHLANLTPYALATLADAVDPDSPTSPGAVFLSRVRDDLIETFEHAASEYPELSPAELAERVKQLDAISETADGAVPVYTHERMMTLVDLAAYYEDVDEISAPGSDMVTRAGVALYMVAERLQLALCDEIAENVDDA